MLIFRQLFDQQSSTYTYLLGCPDSRECILIDPVFEQAGRDMALMAELGLRLVQVIDTHCHADHVTAAWLFKQQTGAQIGIRTEAPEDCGIRIIRGYELEEMSGPAIAAAILDRVLAAAGRDHLVVSDRGLRYGLLSL